jgi:hypothetical protein
MTGATAKECGCRYEYDGVQTVVVVLPWGE